MGMLVNTLKELFKLVIETTFNQFYMVNVYACLDVSGPCSCREVCRADIGANTLPPYDLRMQNIRHQPANQRG